MFFSDMKENIKYHVTKGSKCGAYKLGDMVTKNDNVILNHHVGGWMEEKYWTNYYTDVEVEVDSKYISDRREWLIQELAKLDQINQK